MAGTRAAIRYAKAILDIAQANNNTAQVTNDMTSIVHAVKESNELKNFLQSPIIKGEIKHASLVQIFAQAQKETKSLFQLLLTNKRFELLPTIASDFKALVNELNGIEVAKVTTAFPITADLEAKVLAKIKEFSNKTITLENIVDESIIGGFILTMGDQQYNASVSNRLQNLKREFSY
ncbi:ATP synthase F1 subunit delta [uncultured Flavobacterium sp.]|jgi:F-type H+-transporting ATPase subunit delta|uniref:ATP synthase F1 subunit delta n=1 Tax=uncultured Flavobacterium sp. TaxID=165435 RepID=UPI0030CA4DDE|tara:strand:+ start:2722 stop:3255 length:534 start_codon:yes stop_codon:yes gene_type:complete